MVGALALVVGPSGAGKDTLIAAARAQLAGDARFVFVRRLVTRAAIAAVEDHETIGRAEFASRRERGAFALSWEAHGLGYALPGGIADEIAAGRVVVANVSRRVVSAALARFETVRVLLVDAQADVRAARLGARGRESRAEIAARLARDGSAMPEGVAVTRIDNSGALAQGIAAFVAALREIAGDA